MAEIKGHLTLIGEDFDPSYVSSFMHTTPTWIKRKHDVQGNGKLFGHTEWGVETDTFHTELLPEAATQLISSINCSREKLLELAQSLNAEWNILFSIDIDATDEFPAVYFTSDFLKFASDIGASIGLDVY